MTQQVQEKNAADKLFVGKEDEKVLVVKRSTLFPEHILQGLHSVDFAHYEKDIRLSGEFIWRSQAESDTDYKQIIPYLVFNHEDKFFLMQRKKQASEVRLQNKYSLGIGGHIRQEDMAAIDLFSWAKREFSEEVSFSGSYEIEPIGILNDERDLVGQVHTGFVFLLKGDSANISVRDELKSGRMVTLAECCSYYDAMESWSKMVYDFLRRRANT